MKRLLTLVLKLHELYMILVKAGNQKITINNKVRVIEQIFVLDPVN